MKYEFLQPKFTEGVLAKSLQGRSIEEFYHYGYKSSKNMIPVLSGPVVKRPGTNFIAEVKDPTAIFIPFFKDKDNTYILELGIGTTTLSCDTVNTDATVTTASTTTLREGEAVSGTGIPADATISSITDATHFELSAAATNSATVTLTFVRGYLRVWSQDQLLFQKTGAGAGTASTTIYYETASRLYWTQAELSTLKFTQSGDIIFVCCPTRKPYRIFRTLITTDTIRATDDSFWTVDEFVMTDGPYGSINVYSEDNDDKKFTLKLTTEPTTPVVVGTVEFNTVDDSLVLANHGLQTGQKIKLDGQST